MKKLGFTLAETLIVIAIIGIIASIVTPMLFGTTNNAENIAKWKKSYADISQAWRLASLDHGGTLNGVFTAEGNSSELDNTFGNLLLEKMNYIKKGPSSATETTDNPCWHEVGEYFTLNGTEINSNFSVQYTAILSNGAYVRIGAVRNRCVDGSADCQLVYFGVDVNGSKKPNMQGKDIFYCGGRPNGIVKVHGWNSDPSAPGTYSCLEDSTSTSANLGQHCSKLALYCDDIDYTTGTCKAE
ncbi:MAG: prepilin-type N-terminal cleavage/methylation domain-containing protein [Candidatus Gastranaerophilales bacterium]|nr:prepilin-type N-terminal cleavage/methylation domain-containing protein [Candidatus Gastranaerophilales bacterium]